jgi:hypothetical protein
MVARPLTAMGVETRHHACSMDVKTERCRSDCARMNKARTTMKHLQTSLREMAQINTLIINLTRSVELLNFDIDAVEEHALVRDVSEPAYPILARHLRIRRENLTETITALRARVGKERPSDIYSISLAG